MDSKYSVVEFFPDSSGTSCGYCKSSDTNFNIGMWAHTMTVEDYQDLIDRGWRRSGLYCYKSSLKITCCPLYTIKCEALNLKLSKSQKKLLKRISRYIIEGRTSHSCENFDDDCDSYSDANSSVSNHYDNSMNQDIECKLKSEAPIVSKIDTDIEASTTSLDKTESRLADVANDPFKKHDMEQRQDTREPLPSECLEKKTVKNPRPGVGQDITKPQCKKAKLLRLEKKKKKLAERGTNVEGTEKVKKPQEKSLEEYIQESIKDDSVHKLELKLVRSSPQSKEFEKTFKKEHELYQKYQMAIHKDPITKVVEHNFKRFLVTSPLKIRLVPSKSDRNSLRESWQLFVKYQTIIHREEETECDYQSFYSFLVESPLQAKNQTDAPSVGYGSFHQQYWLNGNLIAVGVIDILPKCVSSVYFFYDPDYSHLSLGTYGTLRELELVRSLQKEVPSISEYYMGYYIHTCPKMRYKSRYTPSYLLCPEVYTWHPIAECVSKLDKAKYSRFNDDINAVCEDSFINLNRVNVLWKQIAMHYSSYKMRSRNSGPAEDDEVALYAQLVGRKCAERMLLYKA